MRSILYSDFIGNKAKRANVKTGITWQQSTLNFPKNEHFLPSGTHVLCCVKNWNLRLFWWNFAIFCDIALIKYYATIMAPKLRKPKMQVANDKI